MTKLRTRSFTKISDPIDEFFDKNGCYRKQLPRDGSCLFRAAAEMFCLNQNCHDKIRQLVVDYMELNKPYFSLYYKTNFSNHMRRLRNPMEKGGYSELDAISHIFETSCFVHSERKLYALNDAFSNKLCIYFDKNCNHFDLVFSKSYTAKAGFCQALIYEALYKDVFGMDDVQDIVDQMLHNSNGPYRTDSCTSQDMQEIFQMVNETMNSESCHISTSENNNSKEVCVTPPFPYRVAKSLDRDIYRNIEYDAWKVLMREAKYGPYDKNGLQIGVKVDIDLKYVEYRLMREFHDKLTRYGRVTVGSDNFNCLHGYIQSMTENQGPVCVYAEELGKIITVPYCSLEKSVPVISDHEGNVSYKDMAMWFQRSQPSAPRKRAASTSEYHKPNVSQSNEEISHQQSMPTDEGPKAKTKAIAIPKPTAEEHVDIASSSNTPPYVEHNTVNTTMLAGAPYYCNVNEQYYYPTTGVSPVQTDFPPLGCGYYPYYGVSYPTDNYVYASSPACAYVMCNSYAQPQPPQQYSYSYGTPVPVWYDPAQGCVVTQNVGSSTNTALNEQFVVEGPR